jgi:hypothetical protein
VFIFQKEKERIQGQQRTVVINETTGMFMSVRQRKKIRTKLCKKKKKLYRKKRETAKHNSGLYYQKRIYSDLTHKTEKEKIGINVLS